MTVRNSEDEPVVHENMGVESPAGTETAESPRPVAASGHTRRRFGAVAAERFRARIRANKVLNTTWRVVVFVIGILVAFAGLIMLVTPGPGWLAVVLGFAILATEFVWARRALRRAQRAAKAAKDKALDPKLRRRNQILTLVAGAMVVGACIAYVGVFGMTLPWNPDVLRELP